ncbi:MAG: hypothetical protein WAM39_20395 [Bryobacteraceae bacterium]
MPPFPQLPKWKTNQIFEAIQSVGLDPNEFAFEDSGAEIRFKHKWSKSCFVIGGNAGHYVGRYVVGDAIVDWPYEVYSWESFMTRFGRWARDVKGDLDTPDLWAELQRGAGLLGGVSGEANENTPFTSEEQKGIQRRLREMEAHVRSHSLPEPEMEILHTKIDYLVDAAGRLGRIDWGNAFIGAIVGYILVAGLPPESARSLITFVVRAIGHFFWTRLMNPASLA